MPTVPYALYDAFSDTQFGGSQAGIVLDAGGIGAEMRLRIARELGLPAVCFVTAHTTTSITARFQSTEREYPMCGHGTIGLITHMIEHGLLTRDDRDQFSVELNLPDTTANIDIIRRDDNRPIVMLDIRPPDFRTDLLDTQILIGLLGITTAELHPGLPIETALGDFVHLIVPVKNLAAMHAIRPNSTEIARFCQAHDLETIACFSTEVELPGHHVHVRDFCPAVGVPESAAAGTTNAALTSYMIRHRLAEESASGSFLIKAEQGLEINRPSTIQSRVTLKGDKISRLQVGGLATKVLEGRLQLPAITA